MRILLIDDDKDDQILFREAISRISSDFQCVFADNGIAGLNELKSAEPLPDVVFLDVNMPLMDGRETLRAIRNDLALKDLTVIIYSTSNSEQEIAWFLERNARYVVKPNNFERLAKMLSEVLNEVMTSVTKEF